MLGVRNHHATFLTPLKLAGQQPVRHLPEEIARGVMTAHIHLTSERNPPAHLDIVGCCCT